MSELKRDLQFFWGNRIFRIGLPLIMVLSYITLLVNPTVGIDDTSFKIYYVDGLSPYMGRWCLYLINKLLPLNYNPHFVEAVGLLCFCLSVSLWCVVFRRAWGNRLSIPVYTVFAGVMISSPILSEVVIWYLQDGIYLGYGVTALALLLAQEAFQEEILTSPKKRAGRLVGSAVLLAVGMGFYESFMIVFLMGAFFLFLLIRVLGSTPYSGRIRDWFGNLAVVGVLSMLFRSIAIDSVVRFFQLQDQANILRSRDLGDIFGVFFSWFSSPQELEKLLDIVREFFVKYYCNAVVYLPIMVLVLAMGIICFWAVWKTVEKRDVWILLAVLGMVLLPLVLALAEGVATYYRSSQYIPLLTALAVLVTAWEGGKIRRGRWVRPVGLFLACFLLYQQAYEMNRWLYVDARKYEDDKRTASAVALEIMAHCDTTKPVCVIGSYRTPESLLEEAYCPTWSKKYTIVKTVVSWVDPELFEKYDRPQGYVAVETPLLSTLNWASTAYYGFDRELIKFWKMHGFTFVEDGELSHYEEARAFMQGGPVWPQEGSIVEREDYIIVNFGESSVEHP